MEQQRPPPSEPNAGRRRWFQSCMVRPIILWPSRARRPATVELSTPPLIATAMGLSGMCGSQWRNFSEVRNRAGYGVDEGVHLLRCVRAAERKANAGAGAPLSGADGEQHVRRLDRAAGARRAAGHGEPAQVEREDHGLA